MEGQSVTVQLNDLPLDKLNPRARHVIDVAGRFAEKNGDSYIGSEHLLLAIAQPNEGVAWSVLENLGFATPVREALEKFLKEAAAQQGREQSTG